MTGVEMTTRDRKVATRSEIEYCLVAVQAPSAVPSPMPTKDPRKTRRTETHMRREMISPTSSPLGVLPQSQWVRTPVAQTRKRSITGSLGLML